MKKLPDKFIARADRRKIVMRELTPNRLELEIVPSSSSYEIRLKIVYKEEDVVPMSEHGMKDMKFSRWIVTRNLYSKQIDHSNPIKSMRVIEKVYNTLVDVIKRGDYTLYNDSDGRLEFKWNEPVKGGRK